MRNVILPLLLVSLSGCGRLGFALRDVDPEPGERRGDRLDAGVASDGDGTGSGSHVVDASTAWRADGGTTTGPSDASASLPDGAQPADASVLPTVITLEHMAARVSAGPDDGCAVRADGSALCWGYDANGERGDGAGNTSSQDAPTAVVQSTTGALASIDMGFIHACALTPGGVPYCWGDNFYGQLGDAGLSSSSAVPVLVSGGKQFTALSVGSHHACGIDGSGALWCWGRANGGQLGSGPAGQKLTVPTLVSGARAYDWVGAGKTHTCAIDRQGKAFCWGENGDGQLGTGNSTDHDTPIAVTSSELFRSIDAGTTFTCALTRDDRALCWGSGSVGELGDGLLSASSTPVAVAGGLRFAKLTVSGEDTQGFAPAQHACALTHAGEAYCWGSNEYGQLGAGDTTRAHASTPVRVDQSECGPLIDIAAGFGFTCAIGADERTWCWGFDGTGELGAGTGRQDSQVPVRVLLP